MSRLVVIVNPGAAGGRARTSIQAHLDALRSSVVTVDVIMTDGPGHATEIARRAATDRVQGVVAAGGDGTVFEVVNGLMAVDDRPALGVLPIGTGNSFVRDMGLRDPADAVAAILTGRTRPVDVVRVEHGAGVLHYVNLLSLGFSARAGALTNRRYKHLGALGYVLAVLQCLVRLDPDHFPHRCDTAALDDGPLTLLSFCNSRYTGGDMMMAPEALVDDGMLDVIRIGAMGRRRFLGSFPRIFRGTHPAMAEVTASQAVEVRFELPGPVEVMVDGEIETLDLRSLRVVPAALRVLA